MKDLLELEPIAVQMTFDYSEYSPELAASLERHATNMEGFTKRYAIDMGKELAEAKAEIHAEKKNGWAKWVEGRLGITVQWADRIVKQYEHPDTESKFQNTIEQPVEPIEEVEECVKLRTPREVVEEWFTKYPTLTHLSNREIAKRCGVTEGTVRTYKKEVFPEPKVAPNPVVVEEDVPLPIVEGTIEPSEDVKAAREAKRQQQQERNAQLKTKGVDLPPDTYACLVVDPPWPMQKIERDLYPNQVDFEYPTMDEEALKAFQLPALAADSCHLYLWTTQKHLPFALRLAEHWGFKYQCLMTWVKNVGFTPYSWMYSTEHVLFCTKGNLPLLRQGMRLDFSAKRREHSRKPDEFYDLVREASPEPRLDVFSREQRDGFKQYGNEATKYV